MNIRSNIWKLYIIKGFRWFMLIMPIIVLFFQKNGLSMSQVLLLQSIFSIAIIVFEIPSGYFSDKLGRKTTLILGCVFGFIGFSAYSLSYSFFGFLIAELSLGLGASFISGTDSAIIYDSLVQINEEQDYLKIEGRLSSVGNFSEGIASLFGGLIALTSLRMPFYIQTSLMFFSIPIAFTLIEPRVHRYSQENPAKEILHIVKFSLHDHKEIKWLIFYSGATGASTLVMVWLIQPYFKMVGLPLAYFGAVWGVLNMSVGVFAIMAYRFEKILGKKASLLSLIFLSFTGFMLLGLTGALWSIPFAILFYFVRGISGPTLKDYVNSLITSEIRATVLSVKNMFGRVLFSVIGPFIGWVSDIYSLKTALLTSGGIFLSLGLFAFFFLHRNETH